MSDRSLLREWFPKRTIGLLVDERAQRYGAREALYFSGERWSFARLAAEIRGGESCPGLPSRGRRAPSCLRPHRPVSERVLPGHRALIRG